MSYTYHSRVFSLALAAIIHTAAWGQTSVNSEEALRQAITDATAAATVTLDADITLTGDGCLTIEAGKDITLDLNGHSITANKDVIRNYGKLTLTDNSEGKTGGLVSNTATGIAMCNNSTTVIAAGSITAVEGCVITGYATGASLTVNGGTFTCTDNAVIAGNGSAKWPDGTPRETPNTITINGGTFNGNIKSAGYVACGIYCPWKDKITVTGGTFNITGGAGIVSRSGTVTVTGGTFNCTGNATGMVGDSRVVVPCSPVVFDTQANYPSLSDDSKIEVTAGTFTSENGIPVMVVAKAEDAAQRVAVSGGSYSAPVSQAYCKDGFTTSLNPDGTYGVSTTFTVLDNKPLTLQPTDNFTVATATYTRAMPAGTHWGTVCLPFNIKQTEAVKLYTVADISGNVLHLTEQESVAAGTPAVFYTEGTEAVFTTAGATVSGALPATSGTLVGTFFNAVISGEALANAYFINSDAFHQARVSLTVPAYRAYIIYNVSQATKPSVLVIDNSTTGITERRNDASATAEAYYSANGIRRNTAAKGINIVRLSNGRTVKVVK